MKASSISPSAIGSRSLSENDSVAAFRAVEYGESVPREEIAQAWQDIEPAIDNLPAAPRFVFLERPCATLGVEHADRTLGLLRERSITCLTLGDGGDCLEDYDVVLELADDGAWTWKAPDAKRAGVAGRAERS